MAKNNNALGEATVGNNEKATKLGGCTGKGFLPGQSGNPSGRPKRKHLTDLCNELLEEKLGDPKTREQLKDAVWQKLLSSRVVGAMTMDQVWDRTEGKVAQQVELSGEVALTLSDRMAKARQRVQSK